MTKSTDNNLPDYQKQRTSIRIDEPLINYISETTGNVSGTINRILWDLLDEEIPQDGPETVSPDVRRRVLRIQRESLKKEIHELEMMLDRIETTLEKMDERPDNVWLNSIYRAIKGHRHPRNGATKLVEASDPDPEEDTDESG